MPSKRRLLFLIGLLLSLTGIQQSLALWKSSSSGSRVAEYQSQIDEDERQAQLVEAESVRSGALWIGLLHDDRGASSDDDLRHLRTIQGPQKIISARVDFEQDSLSAELHLHECSAGSPLCSSGGNITVYSGNRVICRVAMWILQPLGSAQRDGYRVSWEPWDNGLPLTEGERRKMLRQLAGVEEFPNRLLLHRLVRTAYDYEPPAAFGASSESVEQQIVRAVCLAILHSRVDQEKTLVLDEARPNQ